MSVDRRMFLKGAAVASAAAIAPAGLAAAAGSRARQVPEWHRAPCRFCGIGCGLLVAVQDGRAVAVRGDLESPVNRGMACVRGYHAIHTLYGRDRVTSPLIRHAGRLVAATPADAYDLIAGRIKEVVASQGADATGVYGSGHWSVTDAYVAAKLFKAGLGTNNVDTSTRLYHASATAGFLSTFGQPGAPGCFADVEFADTFVLWGHNMAETDPVLFSRILERRRTSPAVRIITLGTQATRTSYAADRALLHRPHAEIALANAICSAVVRRGGVDRNFVSRHVAFARGTDAPGYGAHEQVTVTDDVVPSTFDAFVRFLEDYRPEQMEAATGVAAADLNWLAALYADRGRKVLSVWGSDLNQHVRGTWLNNALHNIHLITGKVASPGNGALCCAAQPGGADAVHAAGATPDGLPRGSVSSAADRQHAARIWGVPASRISAQPGRTALAMFRGVESGAMRFLWVQATNPLASLPNARRYRRAVADGNAFLVVTEAYPTVTSAAADVVLPAALWLEREGVYGSSERRSQYFPRVVPAPGSARADGWHMVEVGRRLGFGALLPWQEQSLVADAWAELIRFHPTAQPVSLAVMRNGPGAIWPFGGEQEAGWRYSTAHDPGTDRSRGAFHFYGYSDGRARIWLRPHEPPAEMPDERYPFWLTVGRVLEHGGTGTLTRRVPALQRAVPRAYVELSRKDATALGIRDGERVRLVTRRGSLEMDARIEHRSQPQQGQVFVPCFDEDAPVNLLTLDACCPLAGQPDYGKCAVRVERLT
ncbi:MAG TPA: molybdopterin-dependent oxidoreductase [Longimicrobiales bacterium]|nr:molybdopterin-dependent oxidoreductase [Longimicrobiales bacterium]